MRPIPQKLRNELSFDLNMNICVLRVLGIEHECGPVQWHHPWIYARKQINEYWAIVPVCENAHNNEVQFRLYFEFYSLLKARPEDLAKYPKFNWYQRKMYICSELFNV